MAASSVKVVDKGATALLRAMRSMDGSVTSRVGVFGEKAKAQHNDDAISNGALAAVHEFGVGVPERSFVRGWVDQSKPEIVSQLKATATAVASGKGTIYQGMHRFGQWGDLAMVKRITAHIPPPLSPVTVARKGHAVPLVETGELLRSIDSAVERNEQVVK